VYNQVFFPASLVELFSSWSRFPDAQLYAGGTEHIRNQAGRIPALPKNIISLDKLEELHKVSRTERYLEIGAMVKLNQILQLGRIVPEVLTRAIECIAGPEIRNQATIGGNICNSSRSLDCSGPMIALDAQYELRTSQASRWILASRFLSDSGSTVLGHQEILTRIRIPLEPWDFTWYSKLSAAGSNEPGGGILFIIRAQKNILTGIRVIYSGQTILRDKDSETMLKDKQLPLDKKDAANFIERWKDYLSTLKGSEILNNTGEYHSSDSELAKARILNFIETTIHQISD